MPDDQKNGAEEALKKALQEEERRDNKRTRRTKGLREELRDDEKTRVIEVPVETETNEE